MKELVLGGSIGGNDVLWFLTSLFLVQVLFNEMTMKNIKAPYVAIGGIIIAYLCHFLHIEHFFYNKVKNIHAIIFLPHQFCVI